MPALKVHVRPPHKHTGLMILCAVYGIMIGCIAVLLGRIGPWATIWFASVQSVLGPGVLMPIIMFGGIVVPPLIVAYSLARSCQHKWPTFLCGQVLGSCIAVVGSISQLFLFSGSILLSEWWQYLEQALGCLVFGAVTGLGFLLVRFLYENFVAVLVEQDGTMCVKCGYCIARSPSDRCSECGAPVDTPIRRLGRIQRLAEFLGSHAKQMAYIASLLVAVGAAFVVWHQLPVWRFSSTIAAGREFTYSAYNPAGERSKAWFEVGPETGREVEVGSSMAFLVVQLHRPAIYEEALVQLRLASRVSFGGPPGSTSQPNYYFQDGDPRVVCELNEAQTRYVLKHDIPQGLIDALVEAAEEAGWAPTTPAAPVPTKGAIVVSADGHFPELGNGEN